jgi:hypothetical protein
VLFVVVGIKGALVAEHFAVMPGCVKPSRQILKRDGRPGDLHDYIKQLEHSGVVDRAGTKCLDTLRRLGNNARHKETSPFTAADKPRVADAVYAVAELTAAQLNICVAPAVRAAPPRPLARVAQPAPPARHASPAHAPRAVGGLAAQIERIRAALNITLPPAQLLNIAQEANAMLELEGAGMSLPAQIAQICVVLFGDPTGFTSV